MGNILLERIENFGSPEVQIGIHGVYRVIRDKEGPAISFYKGKYDSSREGESFFRVDCFGASTDPKKGPHYHIRPGKNGANRFIVSDIKLPDELLGYLIYEKGLHSIARDAEEFEIADYFRYEPRNKAVQELIWDMHGHLSDSEIWK